MSHTGTIQPMVRIGSRRANMKLRMLVGNGLIAVMLASPLTLGAQTYSEHEHAKYEQERHDARHHTKAKIVGGSAAGGAVVGALAGGPKGAVLGAGVGAAGGLAINHVRKQHDIHKRERRDAEYNGYR
jgi:hypothetical protein